MMLFRIINVALLFFVAGLVLEIDGLLAVLVIAGMVAAMIVVGVVVWSIVRRPAG